jgi:hypothetical protein
VPSYDDESARRSLKAAGRSEFDKAHFAAFWEEIREIIRNKPVGLLSFEEVKDRLHLNQAIYRGLQDVPLDRIVGSVGRYREFTRNFLPKNTSMADRWSNVYAQINSLEGVPPIEVYQVDDVYFVRDGNHRVSIARQLKLTSIEAYVTELQTPIDLEPDMTKKELDAASAYSRFLKQTRLDSTRPKQARITLTEPSRYNDLLQHIAMVQRVMTQQRESWGEEVDIPLDKAAARWYDNVYWPCVKLIRKYDLLDQFPARTEADLYLWIVSHFQRLMDTYGAGAEEVNMSSALVDFLAENNKPIPKPLLDEDEEPPIL